MHNSFCPITCRDNIEQHDYLHKLSEARQHCLDEDSPDCRNISLETTTALHG